MPLPRDYAERVYASVLGKIICVYLAARVQGLRRYYALLLVPGALRFVKMRDGGVALVVEEGRTATRTVRIQPVEEG